MNSLNGKWYIKCSKTGNKKISYNKIVNLFNEEYEKSLNNKNKIYGFGMDLWEFEENGYYLQKWLSVSVVNSKILVEVWDDTETDETEYYCYMNSEMPLTSFYGNFSDLIEMCIHKRPLCMFIESKMIIYEILKDFFDYGNIEKIKENYLKNKKLLEKYE